MIPEGVEKLFLKCCPNVTIHLYWGKLKIRAITDLLAAFDLSGLSAFFLI